MTKQKLEKCSTKFLTNIMNSQILPLDVRNLALKVLTERAEKDGKK